MVSSRRSVMAVVPSAADPLHLLLLLPVLPGCADHAASSVLPVEADATAVCGGAVPAVAVAARPLLRLVPGLCADADLSHAASELLGPTGNLCCRRFCCQGVSGHFSLTLCSQR